MSTPAATTGEAEKPVKVRGWILTLFTMIAVVIGLAPVALYLGRPQLLLYFAVGSGLVAASYFLSKDKATATHPPALSEIVLAGAQSISLWGFLGLIWLGFYKAVYWVIWIFADDPARLAYYPVLVIAGLIGIAIAVATAQSLHDPLYFIMPGTRSVYYTQIVQKRGRLLMYTAWVLFMIVIEAVLLWVARGTSSTGFYLILQLIPYFAGAPLLILGSRSRTESNVIEAVIKLLSALGYTVIRSPHTGDEALDPMLGGLDLIAYDEDRAFAIDVKSSSNSTEQVEWTAASSLRFKAKALEFRDVCEKLGVPSLADKTVQPLMMLVEIKQADSLVEFSKEESFPIETIENKVIDLASATDDQSTLLDLASKHLHHLKPSGVNTASAPSSAINQIGG